MSVYRSLTRLVNSVPDFGNAALINTEATMHGFMVQSTASTLVHSIVMGLMTFYQHRYEGAIAPFVSTILIIYGVITLIRDGLRIYYTSVYLKSLRAEIAWRRMNLQDLTIGDYLGGIGNGLADGFMGGGIVNFVEALQN